MQEREMAHHNRNIGFFSMIAGSVLAAAVLAFNASPPLTAH
jgi:hypothetical protein